MSTLTEIEQAIATLPVPEQRELYRHLWARLGSSAAPAAEEDLQGQRTARLLEKQVK